MNNEENITPLKILEDHVEVIRKNSETMEKTKNLLEKIKDEEDVDLLGGILVNQLRLQLTALHDAYLSCGCFCLENSKVLHKILREIEKEVD